MLPHTRGRGDTTLESGISLEGAMPTSAQEWDTGEAAAHADNPARSPSPMPLLLEGRPLPEVPLQGQRPPPQLLTAHAQGRWLTSSEWPAGSKLHHSMTIQ